MKRILSLLLVLAVFLCGCDSAGKTDPHSSASDSAPASTSEPASAENESETDEEPDSKPESESESSSGAEITLGELNGSSYTNDSLGISINIPEGWYPMSDEQRAAMMNVGMEVLADGDAAKKAALDMAAQKTLVLVGAFETDPLTATSTNANLILMAEKVDILGAAFIKSAGDYIKATTAQMESMDNIQGTPISYKFGDVFTTDLNGSEFSVLPIQMQLADGTLLLQQEYYVFYTNDYIYVAITSFMTDEQKDTLNASLGTLTIR